MRALLLIVIAGAVWAGDTGPAYFEPNLGQTDAQVQFLSRGGAQGTTFFTAREVVFAGAGKDGSEVVRMKLRGAKAAQFVGEDELASVSAYFRGNDPSKWLGRVPNYGRIRAREVYPGVDVTYYEQQGRLEYDFVVGAGADPSRIEIAFDGAGEVRVDRGGDLVLTLGGGERLVQRRPRVYQVRGGKEMEVAAGYLVVDARARVVAFQVGEYDRRAELVIDPVLQFSAVTGEQIGDIAVDSTGAIYTCGFTNSTDYPTINPLQQPNGSVSRGMFDVVVSKGVISPATGRMQILFRTYLGSSGEDAATAIAVDGSGSVYIGGFTAGSDFPLANAIAGGRTLQGVTDGFAAKLAFNASTSSLTLVYSTYFGGGRSDRVEDLAIDGAGAVHITGWSEGGITTATPPLVGSLQPRGGQFEGGLDAFVAKLVFNPVNNTLQLAFSTLMGGDGTNLGSAIGVDALGAVYVAGYSTNPGVAGTRFPTANPLPGGDRYSGSEQGNSDAFVSKLVYNAALGRLEMVYSTLLGGGGSEWAKGIIAEPNGTSVIVAGDTTPASVGQPAFPIVNPIAGHIRAAQGTTSAFLTRLTFDAGTRLLSMPFSTLLGPEMMVSGLAMNLNGSIVVSGYAGASFPTVNPLAPNGAFHQGNGDGFLMKLALDQNNRAAVGYSTLFGSQSTDQFGPVAIDAFGAVYLVGSYNPGLPLAGELSPPAQAICCGRSMVVKIADGQAPESVLTVVRNGAGMVRAVSDYGRGTIQCGATCSAPLFGLVTLEAGADVGWVFGGWSGECTGTGSCTVFVGPDKLVMANFYRQGEAPLTTVVKRGRGNGTITGPVSSCDAECRQMTLLAGESGVLTAQAGTGSVFRGWTGSPCSGTGNCQIAAFDGKLVAATFEPEAGSGYDFIPLPPCRVVDTRLDSVVGLGKPAMGPGETRSFVFSNAPCGVPAGAAAYSVNFTVVPRGPLPYITAFPTGQRLPTVSTLNSLDGRVKANAAIVPAGVGSAVSVFSTAATELVIDINGYFVPAGTLADGLAFYPLTPCRIVDTRLATGPLGGPALVGQQSRTLPVMQSACGVPASARAYSLNATTVSNGPMPFLTLYPTGQALPTVSTLNALVGNVVANAAIVPAGTNGSIDAYAAAGSHFVLDINGYFAPAGGSGALRFRPVSPCRVTDTRSSVVGPLNEGQIQPGVSPSPAPRVIPVTLSNCAIPESARAYALNATVVPSGGLAYLTMWPFGLGDAPVVSTLNALDGSITSNAAIVPAGVNGGVNVIAPGATLHLVLDVSGYFAP